MKRLISYLLAFITILLFTSSTSTIVRMDIGNPVTGGEIYIELEPDDEPIACCSGGTGGNGQYLLALPAPLMDKIALRSNPSAKLSPYKLKVFVTVPVGFIETKIPKTTLTKATNVRTALTLNFSCNLKNGTESTRGNFKIVINNIDDKSEIVTKTGTRFGPYTLLLKNPNSPNVTISLQNTSTSVNNYGINDEGIK